MSDEHADSSPWNRKNLLEKVEGITEVISLKPDEFDFVGSEDGDDSDA